MMIMPARALGKIKSLNFELPDFSCVAKPVTPCGLGPMAVKLRSGGFRFSYNNLVTSVGRRHILPPDQASVMRAFIDYLLLNNIIERAPRGPFLSFPFLIPKASGAPRLIIDYAHLTPFLNKPKISLPLFSDILRVHPVPRGLKAVRLDLSHAFYSLPVHDRSKFITTFMFDHVRYRFNRLPMGLSPSPALLQSTLMEALAPFKNLFSIFWVHVDDVLLAAPETLICEQLPLVIRTLHDWAFALNVKKSVLKPVSVIAFLGLWLDFKSRAFRPAPVHG